ncbi:MAG: hypothetical protein QXV05_04125 [Candidatus Korarchaeum sp.]
MNSIVSSQKDLRARFTIDYFKDEVQSRIIKKFQECYKNYADPRWRFLVDLSDRPVDYRKQREGYRKNEQGNLVERVRRIFGLRKDGSFNEELECDAFLLIYAAMRARNSERIVLLTADSEAYERIKNALHNLGGEYSYLENIRLLLFCRDKQRGGRVEEGDK